MNIISVKQLRENFWLVKEAVERGQSLLLVYRSKPLAEIKPVEKFELESDKRKRVKNNLEELKKLSGGLKLGRGWPPAKLNRLYNKQYECLLP